MRFGSVCSGNSKGGRRAIDLLGQRFGRLVVLERVANHKRVDRPTWRCICDCGTEITLYGGALRSGQNKSCGCYRRDRAGQLYRKHGKSKTPQYTMFYDARKRATKFGVPFGIEPEDIHVPDVCPVLGLRLNAGDRESAASLDRIRPELGYVKGNIRVISFRANRLKSDATPEELAAVLAYVNGEK